jgi:hypothetical protein
MNKLSILVAVVMSATAVGCTQSNQPTSLPTEVEQAITLVNSKTLSDCLYERIMMPVSGVIGSHLVTMHVIRCPNSSVTTKTEGKYPVSTTSVDQRGSGK